MISTRNELKAYNSSIYRQIESLLLPNWWLILFSLACFIVYEQALSVYDGQRVYLTNRLTELKSNKDKLLATQEDLKLQINSQSDPLWIEQTLMKVLGVVPEGQTKIYFHRN